MVINGEVKFALEVPLENDLGEAIHHPDKFPDILGSLHKRRTVNPKYANMIALAKSSAETPTV